MIPSKYTICQRHGLSEKKSETVVQSVIRLLHYGTRSFHPALLQKYQANCRYPKLHRANPEWDNCISIDYWQEGKVPRGMVFSQQVTSDKQDSAHDSYRMPQSLYIRLACTKEVSQAAFGKDECSVWELFGVIKDALDDLRCKIGTNGAQEIEMYNHGAGLAYAYVPVEKNEHKGEFSLHTLGIPLISSDDSISPFDNRIVCLK